MYDFKTNVSVLTNITPTHLDFHASYDVYKSMKKKIFNHHTKEDYAIINSSNEESLKVTSDINSTKLYYGPDKEDICYYDDEAIYYAGKEIIKLNDIVLKGEHNYQNITSAIKRVLWN